MKLKISGESLREILEPYAKAHQEFKAENQDRIDAVNEKQSKTINNPLIPVEKHLYTYKNPTPHLFSNLELRAFRLITVVRIPAVSVELDDDEAKLLHGVIHCNDPKKAFLDDLVSYESFFDEIDRS